ncbi:cell division protein FtsW [Patescibacteria group bacterium]|nr:cell division protein FtsW [Patescibacteria group bacterium]
MPRNPSHLDYALVGITVSLLVLGVLIISSVSASVSQERFGQTLYYLKHQVLLGILPGVILAIVFLKIPLNFLKKRVPVLFLINLGVLGMVFLPKIGVSLGGAARWINLGPISLQPTEFLKLTFILYLASWLSSKTEKVTLTKKSKKFSQTLVAFLIVMGLTSLLLIRQPDISTLGVIVLVGILIYFLAGTPLWHSILMILVMIAGLLVLIKIAPYRAERLSVFFNPEIDPMGMGYQIKQALITVGSGGITGLGLGMSKAGFLPRSMSDSIFAIFAEETGFIGSLILISLFLIFFWRGFKIAKEAQDKFSQLAALGISSWIIIQAFVNIGSMVGILPLTGIPLPFISYGGSHLISELIGVGVLLNISKHL